MQTAQQVSNVFFHFNTNIFICFTAVLVDVQHSKSSLQDFLQIRQDLDQLTKMQALFPVQNHRTMEWVSSEETTVGSYSPFAISVM